MAETSWSRSAKARIRGGQCSLLSSLAVTGGPTLSCGARSYSIEDTHENSGSSVQSGTAIHAPVQHPGPEAH